MSEISKYEAYKKKLEGICDENELTFRFSNNTYPITLTVRPITEGYTQMSILENTDEKEHRSQDSYLRFVYQNGVITYQTSETFEIGDALFSKLKNLFKNMHYCWLQYFFRTVIGNEALIEEFEDLDIPDAENAITDEEIDEATRIVRMENKASTVLLQRRMNIGEDRAVEIIATLEDLGVVGPYNYSESRDVLPYDEPDDAEEED